MPYPSTSRREFLARLTGVGVAAALVPPVRAAEAARPNILILQPDQHRGTILGCAGDGRARTPNLDRLAAEGIRFTHCASSSPVCSPFRGSLQTGLYPHRHGVTSNNIRLRPDVPCLAEVFAAAGYATGYIGKWHLDGGLPKKEGGPGLSAKAVGGFVPAERRRGWQEWHGYEKAHEYFEVWRYDTGGRKVRVEGQDWEPAWQTDMALDFARRHSKAGRPWLYYVAYGPPHLPEQCPREFLDRFDPAAFELPPDMAGRLSPADEAKVRRNLQLYYAQVAAVDHEVGLLLAGLRDLGIDQNTIVLYTSDHGDMLGSHWSGSKGGTSAKKDGSFPKIRGKACPYADAFRIPLIVRGPDRIAPGRVCDAPVSSVDLAPTILELAGLAGMPGMQGMSMAGWCLRGDGPRPEGVWIGLGNWRAVWDGRYLYAPVGYRHLYDHLEDPRETVNLMESPEHRPVRRRLHDLLVSLAERSGDPMTDALRRTPVP